MADCVWLLRHGDTDWTEQGRHTGRADVPLSDTGRGQARQVGSLLAGRSFQHVLVSPQTRARETCSLAGFGGEAQLHDELVEWDYGDYEGLTDAETQDRHPGWALFRDGCPGGESPVQVSDRADRVLAELSGLEGACLLVGHGKLLRALAARWVRLSVAHASILPMDPAAVSLLEREADGPLLRLWNYTGQLAA